MNKVFPDARAACADLPDGARLFVGGFGLAGIPEECIYALRDLGPRHSPSSPTTPAPPSTGWCIC